jgi:hypothetical protein
MTIPDYNVTATPSSYWPNRSTNDDDIPIVVLEDPLSSNINTSSFNPANYNDGNIVVSARPVGSSSNNNNDVSGARFALPTTESERVWSQVHQEQQNGLVVEAQPVDDMRASSGRTNSGFTGAVVPEQPHPAACTAVAVPVVNGTSTASPTELNQQQLDPEERQHEEHQCVHGLVCALLVVVGGLVLYGFPGGLV